ncbi:serine/arginine repetitive matrix protein 2-like [Daphnia pulicaria]|uniref:serine/arginine repetitive matrix protein 2-like n=1 Tax=Daphnia pulicaria TaxID=35523 RepID=UPI001EEBA3C8|nr:serine/arginine repetitive matrix protein 2-like [Daphnia pulicaria]
MGSPRRAQQDQDSRVDIKDRLQALAKSSSGVKKSSSSNNDRTASKSQNSSQSGRDRGRNNKLSSRKDSMERVMERARTEGGNRWTKKLLDEEAKDPDRWGHSGFKEMYKNELGISRSRRSRSREKTSARRSRSRERAHKIESGRTTSNRERSGGGGVGGGQRKNVRPQIKRSFSSSDRSPNSDVKRRSDSSKRPSNGASHERKLVSDKFAKTNASRTSRLDLSKKPAENRRELASRKDRVVKKNSPLRSRSRSRSPLRQTEKNNGPSRKQIAGLKTKSSTRRGPVSPPERGRSYSGTPSRSSTSPIARRRNCLSDDATSRSSSSLSHSSFSRSSSSSSSSSGSSTSSSSKETGYRKRSALKPKSPPAPRTKLKEQLRPAQELHAAKQTSASKTVKRPISASNKVVSPVKKRRALSESDSSSNESSSETDDDDMEEGEEEEEGEDTGEGPNAAKELKSGNLGSRLSLSERFGKLAQLSSQRRNLELVQLRIVAPVGGAATTEKNVSIDEASAAPVISNAKAARERSIELSQPPINHHHHHQIKHVHPPEEPIRKDERARDDRWRDWHERYDQYRHVQPPRQLPRDWDDIRVRHKYYTDRGYFGHDMTLEELSRWEAWWHRYQLWRRGYEHAWVKTHGPHVPVEYPDWTNYRSTNNRGEVVQPSSMSSSIRSRLGWRR